MSEHGSPVLIYPGETAGDTGYVLGERSNLSRLRDLLGRALSPEDGVSFCFFGEGEKRSAQPVVVCRCDEQEMGVVMPPYASDVPDIKGVRPFQLGKISCILEGVRDGSGR